MGFKNHNPTCPCCTDEGCLDCSPCRVPKNDLTLAWTGAGGGSTTLTYDGVHTWTGPCLVGDTVRFVAECSGGILLRFQYFADADCSGGADTGCNLVSSALTSYTCCPFSLTFALTNANCPTLYALGYRTLTLTSTMPTPPVCCCNGRICVHVQDYCSGDAIAGAGVTVRDADGNVVGSGSADDAGDFCASPPQPGTYTIVVSNPDCGDATFRVTVVNCYTDYFVLARLVCQPTAGVRIRVNGCFSQGLDGATVVISQGATTLATGTTSGGGYWWFYPPATGTYSVQITPPTGPPYNRFRVLTSGLTVSSVCSVLNVSYTLQPLSGYSCCTDNITFPVFPIPNTLTLTDAGGSASVTGGCSWAACLRRSMDNVSPSNTPGSCSCTGGGFSPQPPPDIGTHDCNVEYEIQMTSASQLIGLANSLAYRADCPTTHQCSPLDSCIAWRTDNSCALLQLGGGHNYAASTVTVLSWFPFSLVAAFPDGNGWSSPATGGACPVLTGEPFSSTVMLNE